MALQTIRISVSIAERRIRRKLPPICTLASTGRLSQSRTRVPLQKKKLDPLETPQSNSYRALIRNREGSRAVALAGRIRDDPLFLFPNHAAFPGANFSRSDSFDATVAVVHSHQQETEQSAQPFSAHRMYWLNGSNIGPGCFPFYVPCERGQRCLPETKESRNFAEDRCVARPNE